MDTTISCIVALLMGYILDWLLGDPVYLPHPIVGFGKMIGWMEKAFNRGNYKLISGAFTALFLVSITFAGSYFILKQAEQISVHIYLITNILIIFFCLAGKTLRKEVKMVFEALNESTEKGRQQLSRIVGRDTKKLSPQQIRCAAMETLSENLSDGVIAPLFWFALLGAPGMLAYKMVNTLDSMIGYKNDRYLLFGRFAARMDDVANYIPARLTAILMLIVSGNLSKADITFQHGKNHASPNSGYPEAALATIIQCRFGGPNYYFGKLVEKPYIGTDLKTLNNNDLSKALQINEFSEIAMLFITLIVHFVVIHSSKF